MVSARDMLLGMLLIILSQAVQAAQLTYEDYFMVRLVLRGTLVVLHGTCVALVWHCIPLNWGPQCTY